MSREQERTPASLNGAVAVLRFERNTAGRENDMPRVMSCRWQPDGEYPVYLAAPGAAIDAREHYDEVKATLKGLHSLMESLSAIERRVGPLGSHARGYTHKITKALNHLDALASRQEAPVASGEEMSPEFTDTARAALLWVLWHHQGASSKVGHPIRFALGMGQFDRLNDHQVAEAKRWEDLAASSTPSEALSPATVAQPVADGSTPGEWFVRKHFRGGVLRDAFVAAPDCQGLAYDAEILGDDEYRDTPEDADAGIKRKVADCELIVAAVKSHRAQPCASQGCGGAVRQALNMAQLNECARDAQIDFALDKATSFEVAFARRIEAAHGIAALSTDKSGAA